MWRIFSRPRCTRDFIPKGRYRAFQRLLSESALRAEIGKRTQTFSTLERPAASPSASIPTLTLDQRFHALPYFITNLSHALDRLALRIFQRPIVTLQARDHWTLFTAAHRDQHLRLA